MASEYFFWGILGFIGAIALFSVAAVKLGLVLLFTAIFIALALFIIPGSKFFILSFVGGFLFGLLRVLFPRELNFWQEQNWWQSFVGVLELLRQSLANNLKQVFPEPIASFSQGIILGGEGIYFEKSFYENLKTTSTLHLIAVSGYNITLISRSLERLFVKLTVHRKLIWVFVVAAVSCFVVFVGAPSSAVRAGIMASLLVVAQRFGRSSNSRNVLVFSLAVMLLVSPLALGELGLQLSFLAFFGIIYVAPLIKSLFRAKPGAQNGWLELLKNIWAETLAAQLMVFPVLLYRFGLVSLLGTLANLITLPLIPYAMGLSFIAGMLGFVSLSLAKVWAVISLPFLGFITATITWFSQLPGASLNVYHVSLLFIAVYYLLIGWWLIVKRKVLEENELLGQN